MLRQLLIAAATVLLLGCSSQSQPELVNHTDWSSQAKLAQWSDVPRRGLVVGFVRPEDESIHPYERPSNEKFQIAEGTLFSTLLILGTGWSNPYPVIVSTFLDYEQVGFSLDGQYGLLHYVEIRPGGDMEIPFEVSIGTPGWHDLFVTVFPEPMQHPTNSQERLPPNFSVGGRRTVVCVRDCSVSPSVLGNAQVHVGETANVPAMNSYAFPLVPGLEPAKRRILLSTHARSEETYHMELWASNPTELQRDYVVIPLLDFKVTLFAGSKLLHFRMPPLSELFVPGEMKLPAAVGVHELQFVYIFDPYRNIPEVSDVFVQSVMRSALIVE
jgi:hypothetical protein